MGKLGKALKRGIVTHSSRAVSSGGSSATIHETTAFSPLRGYTKHTREATYHPTGDTHVSHTAEKVKIGKAPKRATRDEKYRYSSPKESKNRKNWPSNYLPGVNTEHREVRYPKSLSDPYTHRNTTFVHPGYPVGVGASAVAGTGISRHQKKGREQTKGYVSRG